MNNFIKQRKKIFKMTKSKCRKLMKEWLLEKDPKQELKILEDKKDF